MKEGSGNPYQKLQADLEERWGGVAERIRELELRVEAGLDSGGAASADVRELVRYSRLMRRHMAEVEGHAEALLDQIESDPEYERLEGSTSGGGGGGEGGEDERAMLEIQREMHRPSSSFLEVLKAVFLWRDTPEERVERGEVGPAERGEER
jgi:hypothetical protein